MTTELSITSVDIELVQADNLALVKSAYLQSNQVNRFLVKKMADRSSLFLNEKGEILNAESLDGNRLLQQ